MSDRFYKMLLISGLVFIIIALPVFVLSYDAPEKLEVDFFDVGQGDAILIKTPSGQNILIDGGPDSSIIDRLGENLPFWDKKIDLMILTHPHDDHVFGLNEVLLRYEVKKIAYTGVVHNTPGFIAWLEKIKSLNIPLIIIDRPQTIAFADDLKLKILFPFKSFKGKQPANLNNSSIVAKLIYKETNFLFTGDAEKEVESELIAAYKGNNLTDKSSDSLNTGLLAQVLKVGHHGSDTASNGDFLAAVDPNAAVIEVGGDNRFGHPSPRTLNRLERAGAWVYRTDSDGTISMLSDGQVIEVTTAKNKDLNIF